MGCSKSDLKEIINSSTKLDPKEKKTLATILDKEDYRDSLSRSLSGVLLSKATTNPGNYTEHDKLSFVHDEQKFLKNCITIIKNI